MCIRDRFYLVSKNREDVQEGKRFLSDFFIYDIHLCHMFTSVGNLLTKQTRKEFECKLEYIREFILMNMRDKAKEGGIEIEEIESDDPVKTSLRVSGPKRYKHLVAQLKKEFLEDLVLIYVRLGDSESNPLYQNEEVFNNSIKPLMKSSKIIVEGIPTKSQYAEYYVMAIVGSVKDLTALFNQKDNFVANIISKVDSVSIRPFSSRNENCVRIKDYCNSYGCSMKFTPTGITLSANACKLPFIDVLSDILWIHCGVSNLYVQKK
eukprot:TRINITY_DN20641_c0_g1_i5.p1 TRINITY_DN20641_c0_g1~~TRINITY_DN20641_c0_g1_i5.p1  ORF type:complete len:291 (-),score=34.56 TRINITY_DN20641_c0_g1_i5:261-1052(-)